MNGESKNMEQNVRRKPTLKELHKAAYNERYSGIMCDEWENNQGYNDDDADCPSLYD